MKKITIIIGALMAFLLVGCQNNGNNTGEKGLYRNTANTNNYTRPLTVTDGTDNTNDQYNRTRGDKQTQTQIGYVRRQRGQVDTRANLTNNNGLAVDREKMSNAITDLVLSIPNINEAATLVTDEEALVVYNATTNDRTKKADQVRKTALSLLPRYYNVYVTDNPTMFNDIERFDNLNTNSKAFDSMIEKTVTRIKNSSPVNKKSLNENGFGETKDEQKTMK